MESGLTAARLRQVVSYDEETGLFVRLVKAPGPSARWAGCPNSAGYLRISIDGRSYLNHRLAWLYVHGCWPNADLDHINGNPLDNRIVNLRDATRSQNMANARLSKINKHGLKGVSCASDGKFVATVQVNKIQKYLGRYNTAQAAHAAYVAAASKEFGEYARSA